MLNFTAKSKSFENFAKKYFYFTTLCLIASCFLFVQSCKAQSHNPREKIKFDFDWKFYKGNVEGGEKTNLDDSGWRQLDIPHDWSIEGPFSKEWASGTGYLPGGIGWYRKSFKLDNKYKNKKVVILFDGVYMNSDVWINGHHLGKYPYGYSSFYYDLTGKLHFDGQENVLVVRVDHEKFADSRWYTGSGIYRHVWLITTENVHVPVWGTFITTPKVSETEAKVLIITEVTNDSDTGQEVKIETSIRDAQNKVVATTGNPKEIAINATTEIVQRATIQKPKLWSTENPYLYTAVTKIKKDGQILDEYITTFGVRTFKFDADKGFFLNGKNMKVKGVCLHHDAGCLGAAVPDRAREKRLQICKELGANAIRTSHNPPAPELLDLCDKMGFLVIDEVFDEWEGAKNKWIEGRNHGKPAHWGYNEYFKKWAIKDLQAMIKRDRNHPCIILWSIGNEIDFPNDPYSHPVDDNYDQKRPNAERLKVVAEKLSKAVKEMDTTRPVTAAIANAPASNATGYADVLDVAGYNYQEKYYEADHKKYPKRIIMGSENGDSYKAWLAVKNNDYISSQFLWTAIDYLGEAGPWPNRSYAFGIVDYTNTLKPNGQWRKSLWSDEPMAYLVTEVKLGKDKNARRLIMPSWTLPRSKGTETTVICYSNCQKVELFLNGKSMGEKNLKEASHIDYRWAVPYEPGELKAVGKNDGKVVSEAVLRTAGEASKIRLEADRNIIKADRQDISYISVSVTDSNDTVVPSAGNLITFNIEGPGKIIGVDNADLNSMESCKGNQRKAYRGTCMAVVQATDKAGKIILKASSPGLESSSVEISSAK